MLIDITLKITPKMTADAQNNEKITLSGHLGTHFDVMDKEFPLEYTARQGIVLDVSSVKARDIDQYCADRGVFVIENLCNLKAVLDAGGRFTARTCPMNFSEMTGLPCRVIAEI